MRNALAMQTGSDPASKARAQDAARWRSVAAALLLMTFGILCANACAAGSPPGQPATTIRKVSGYPIGRMPESAREGYGVQWGVDKLTVRLTESGALVRFSYRVTDAAKAAPLHDRASSPLLFDERSRAELQVPQMEKVGPLRQSTTPETGKSYWMMFSNKGGLVKVGDRVSVAIGSFRVDGLVVE